jgi:DNA-binding NarL/FixJ family response regulator
MDISMPKMGGMEATRMIHAELPHIRIIGLSMYDDSKTEQGMLDAGATCFVCKSGHSTALLAAIRDRGSTRFSDYTNE